MRRQVLEAPALAGTSRRPDVDRHARPIDETPRALRASSVAADRRAQLGTLGNFRWRSRSSSLRHRSPRVHSPPWPTGDCMARSRTVSLPNYYYPDPYSAVQDAVSAAYPVSALCPRCFDRVAAPRTWPAFLVRTGSGYAARRRPRIRYLRSCVERPVDRAAHSGWSTVQDVGVDHRRTDIAMAEQVLDGPDVVTILEQVRGE